MSQTLNEVRISSVDTVHEAGAATADVAEGDKLEAGFATHYDAVARIIAKVIRDPARAEELAVDLLLRWAWGEPAAEDEFLQARLYRAAVRTGLDELRRRNARARYEGLFGWLLQRSAAASPPTPEQVLDAAQEQERVRQVLCALEPRQAELVLLRGQGLSYKELAAALGVQASSAGTLLARAQGAFRKEYVKRYGERT